MAEKRRLPIDEHARLRADRHAHGAPVELLQHDRAGRNRLDDTLSGLLAVSGTRPLRRRKLPFRRLAGGGGARTGRPRDPSRPAGRRSRKRRRQGESGDHRAADQPRSLAHLPASLTDGDHRSVLGA